MAGKKKYDRVKLTKDLEEYIKNTEIPIIAEFAYQNDIPRSYIYELIPDAIKKLIDKKEAQLERLALEKKIDKTMAIFSLKQLGWKDSVDVNVAKLDGVMYVE